MKSIRFLRALSLILVIAFLLPACTATVAREEETDAPDAPVSGDLRPRVALTFDDGPHPTRTKQIVDELDKYGFHATFFVLGNRIDGTEMDASDAMCYAIDAGNEVGIHGYSHQVYYHKCTDKVYNAELRDTKVAIRDAKKGYRISLMRPPGGADCISDARVENSSYAIIDWDVDSLDWENKYRPGDTEEDWERKVNNIVNNVLDDVEEGSIILMHDIYESTYDAVVVLLARLDEMGYEVVTVSELLGDELTPGKVYHRAS